MSKDFDFKDVIILSQKLKVMMHTSLAEFAAKYNLRPREALFLFSIEAKCGMTIGELVHETFMHQANVSTLVKKLEEDGLILKTRDEHDIRSFNLNLTDKSRKLLESMKEERDAYFKERKDSVDFEIIENGFEELFKLMDSVE